MGAPWFNALDFLCYPASDSRPRQIRSCPASKNLLSPFLGKKSEIFPDGQLAYYRALNLLGARRPVGPMMLVIFRILLVDFELILRDIHKLCSQEHITDPSYFADRSERHRKKNAP